MKSLLKKIIVFILNLEARLAIKKHKPFIISVVGNVGKTSTKEAIYTALKSQDVFVRASKKSFNSEIGVPLTILGLPNVWNNPVLWIFNLLRGLLVIFSNKYPKYLVLELGADKKGDLFRLSRLVKSDLVVYVNIPKTPVHIANYKNKEELLEEKKQVALHGIKDSSVIIYDKDAYYTESILQNINNIRKIPYSANNNNVDIHLIKSEIKCKDNVVDSVAFEFNILGDKVNVDQHKNIAKHFAYPIMAALGVVKILNFNLKLAAEALSGAELGKGRMRLLKGFNNFYILDDSYNASLAAALSAVDTLVSIPCHKRKIAVFADMLELGKLSVAAHRELLLQALSVLDLVFVYGSIMKDVASEINSNKLFVFSKNEQLKLIQSLKDILSEGDLVLIKGSQSMRMEKVVKELLSKELNPTEVLVRQEKAWLSRA